MSIHVMCSYLNVFFQAGIKNRCEIWNISNNNRETSLNSAVNSEISRPFRAPFKINNQIE